jgi:DNA-binding response OmpR family regulator
LKAHVAGHNAAAMTPESPHQVLLVEDDPMIAKTLAMSLRYQGFELSIATSLRQAQAVLAERGFDLLMLDVGLPDGSGVDFCREVRGRDADVPILMLTARTEESTAVESIDGGADDYVRKPYGLLELTARMKRLVQRRAKDASPAFGPVVIDTRRRLVMVDGRDLHLGKREFDILQLLVREGGGVVTREQILVMLDCDREIYDRTIDSHLSHLRRKLKDAGAAVRIAAIYGVGYRLELPS